MPNLNELISHFDELLNVENVPEYPSALNGLQLDRKGTEVEKIVAAVDACLPVVRQAAALDADLLIVHHGMFWSGAQPITGAIFERLRSAMDAGLAIYSCHIPLDVHPELGNNAQLTKALGFEDANPFFPWKGIDLGLEIRAELSREELIERVTKATGVKPHLCPGGPEVVRRIGVITGGAGSEIYAAAKTGIDTFITGEGPHWSYTAAEELGINLIYAGHYATETFGVKALAEYACETFPGISWEFIDHPTGL